MESVFDFLDSFFLQHSRTRRKALLRRHDEARDLVPQAVAGHLVLALVCRPWVLIRVVVFSRK